MSLLRISRRIADEISPHLFKNEVLRIEILPLYDRSAWINVTNGLGAEWELKNFGDAIERGWGRVSWAKLKRIEIVVKAPDPEDPGQLICLWGKVGGLVDLLLCAAPQELPGIKIDLQDTEENGRWAYKDVLQQSLPTDEDFLAGAVPSIPITRLYSGRCFACVTVETSSCFSTRTLSRFGKRS